MDGLVKIREISLKYDISARALKYYEDMGLLQSTRCDDYAYRMYDNAAIKRLEQILILRKLNISIRDIARIFSSDDSGTVLEVLGQKVTDIDGEVALLHELREVVLEFIQQIQQADFHKDSDVKLLYENAQKIERQLFGSDYNGNSANVNRLLNVSEQLEKLPDVRIVELKPCKVATSGYFNIDDLVVVGSFNAWWDEYDKKRKGVSFSPYDFMWYDAEKGAMVWWYAVEEGAASQDVGGYEITDFEGGLYAAAISVDGDDDIGNRVYNGIKKWVGLKGFEIDERQRHQTMFHIVTPNAAQQALGYSQLDIYVPIRVKSGNE